MAKAYLFILNAANISSKYALVLVVQSILSAAASVCAISV